MVHFKHTVVLKKTFDVFEKTFDVFKNSSDVFEKTTVCFNLKNTLFSAVTAISHHIITENLYNFKISSSDNPVIEAIVLIGMPAAFMPVAFLMRSLFIPLFSPSMKPSSLAPPKTSF